MQIEEGVIHRGRLNIPNWAQSPLFICMVLKNCYRMVLITREEHKAGSFFVDCLTTQEVNFKNLVHFFPVAIRFHPGHQTSKLCAYITVEPFSSPEPPGGLNTSTRRFGDTGLEVQDLRTSGHFWFFTTFLVAVACSCPSVINCKFRWFKAFKRKSYYFHLNRKFRTSNAVSLVFPEPTGPRAHAPGRLRGRDNLQCRRILGGRKLVNRIATMKPPSLILWQRKIRESRNYDGCEGEKRREGRGRGEKNYGVFLIFTVFSGRRFLFFLPAPCPLPLTRPISSSLREFQHGAFVIKTIRARPMKTPATQDRDEIAVDPVEQFWIPYFLE